MAFKNELVPPSDQEKVDFFINARNTLHISPNSGYEKWTVDRENQMILKHRWSGREPDTWHITSWDFLTSEGYCRFETHDQPGLIREIFLADPSEKISAGYKLVICDFDDTKFTLSKSELKLRIKEALAEWNRAFVLKMDYYKRSEITLIDADTGKEI